MIKKFEKGIFYILMSVSCISVMSLFVKLSVSQLSVWSLTFLRFFLPLLFLVPYLWFKGRLWSLWPVENFRLQAARSFCVAIAQLSGVYYLTQSTLVDATMMWGTAPMFMPIISRILYKHPMRRVTWISIILSFIGVVLVLQPTTHGLFRPITIFGLLFGLAVAFSQVLYGANIQKRKSAENLFYLFFFSSALLFVPYLYLETQRADLATAQPLIWLFVVIATVATIGNQYFRGRAYLETKSTYLAPFLYFNVILSGLFDWLVFHNPPSLLMLIGFGFVLSGAYLKWSWLKTAE